MTKYRVLILLAMTLWVCDASSNESLPNNKFSDTATFSDFNLNDDYIYWEVRRGNSANQDNSEDEIIAQYDENILTTLTEHQRSLLALADTNKGFDVQCLPGYCPIYGVALLNNSSFIIKSRSDLIYFFGDIDTVSEVAWLLSIGSSYAKYYEQNEMGYRVILNWDNLCGTRGENLVQVYTDGTVELIKELSTEKYKGCV